jgi:hypothetical protein
MAVAAPCGLALAAFGACKLQRAQKPASGRLSINEIEQRNAAGCEDDSVSRYRYRQDQHRSCAGQGERWVAPRAL